jgi:hypothetical protein
MSGMMANGWERNVRFLLNTWGKLCVSGLMFATSFSYLGTILPQLIRRSFGPEIAFRGWSSLTMSSQHRDNTTFLASITSTDVS